MFKVRSVLQEIRELYETNEAEINKETPARAAMVLRHTALERNKRCLLAYLNHRVQKIRDMRWQFGAVLPNDVKVNILKNQLRNLISQHLYLKFYTDAGIYILIGELV